MFLLPKHGWLSADHFGNWSIDYKSIMAMGLSCCVNGHRDEGKDFSSYLEGDSDIQSVCLSVMYVLALIE